MTKTRITTAAIALAAAAGGGLWFYRRADAKEAPSYRLARVERASVRATVSATGALSAVTTVQVGTQASGQVAAIYVDFNVRVKKGQLLARIDPTLQQQAVADAQAGLQRSQAQYDQAAAEYQREQKLYEAKVLTATEFENAQSAWRVAQANVKSAEVALERARQNLSYTAIYAPIDGVVVERNVDVGQTVAASFSAPQLFLIANDLADMQILASVDESDIGRIREGQPVTFTVSSYPNEMFSGTVRQVRLQSATTENVVNYKAVVSVANRDGKLLPGMTATVKFLTAEASDVLTVPNAALRFQPTAAPTPDARPNGAPAAKSAGGTLWTVDAAGRLAPVRVQTGISDGQRTQVAGDGLADGASVIVGANTTGSGTAAASTTSNPFQQQRQQGGRPPGPPPGGF